MEETGPIAGFIREQEPEARKRKRPNYSCGRFTPPREYEKAAGRTATAAVRAITASR